MTTTVINPNIGTPNATWAQRVIATLTTTDGDGRGEWDEVILTPGASDLTFTLPPTTAVPGKVYFIRFLTTAGGAAIVSASTLIADKIEGVDTYTFPAVGMAIIIFNDGNRHWYISGYYPASGTAYTLPAATGAALGGVKITGSPASVGSPTAPVLETDGFIPESALDMSAIASGIESDVVTLIQDQIALDVPAIRAGQVTITTPATSTTVTFSASMPSVNYSVTLTQAAAIIATNADVDNKTINGFDIELSAGLTVTYNWIAIENT